MVNWAGHVRAVFSSQFSMMILEIVVRQFATGKTVFLCKAVTNNQVLFIYKVNVTERLGDTWTRWLHSDWLIA